MDPFLGNPRFLKVMMAQAKNGLTKFASEHFIPFPDEQQMNRWVVLISGLEDVHEFGEFFVEYTAGLEFLEKKAPKGFIALTANGTFVEGAPASREIICISLGEYHDGEKNRTDTWRPSLGLPGFAENVANAFIGYRDLEGGIRIKPYPKNPEERKVYEATARVLARRSRAFNEKHFPEYTKRLDEFIKNNPRHPCVVRLLKKREELAAQEEKHAAAASVTAPASQQVAPATQQVAPASQQVAPATQQVAPATQQVAPATQQVAPAAQQVAPAIQPVAPATQQVAPVTQQVTPMTQQVAPTTQPPATQQVKKREMTLGEILDELLA
ncbi:MAG: hypothetical protein KGL39_01615 [Patescibacteria group bacterium]|nr:hypothetical protein [Patescibacteria group bacterium]